ncbi:hypothetical protein ACLKA7_009642 [Drosophila subpalustris]
MRRRRQHRRLRAPCARVLHIHIHDQQQLLGSMSPSPVALLHMLQLSGWIKHPPIPILLSPSAASGQAAAHLNQLST